jgi:hypothetical protein
VARRATPWCAASSALTPISPGCRRKASRLQALPPMG